MTREQRVNIIYKYLVARGGLRAYLLAGIREHYEDILNQSQEMYVYHPSRKPDMDEQENPFGMEMA